MTKPRAPAWMPAAYEPNEVEAVRALSKGEATPEQQKRALDWVIHTAAATYDMPYRTDADGGERETSFALGRVFVGQQIVKLINMPPKLVAALRDKNG